MCWTPTSVFNIIYGNNGVNVNTKKDMHSVMLFHTEKDFAFQLALPSRLLSGYYLIGHSTLPITASTISHSAMCKYFGVCLFRVQNTQHVHTQSGFLHVEEKSCSKVLDGHNQPPVDRPRASGGFA